MNRVRVSIPDRLIPHIAEQHRTGLWGNTQHETIVRLIERALQEQRRLFPPEPPVRASLVPMDMPPVRKP